MLVTDVGDYLCRSQLLYIGNRLEMSVADTLPFRKSYQNK